MPPGSADVATASFAGRMVRPSALLDVPLELSDTCTVKFAGPKAVGVPLMVPPGESVKPAGSDPELIDHV